MTLVSATSAICTVGGVAYQLVGSGFTVACDRLGGGTITGITSTIAGADQRAVTRESMTAATTSSKAATQTR